MCFFVRVNQPHVDPGMCGIIIEVIKYVIIGAALTGFVAASLYSDENSSIVFRLAKPIIVDSWKALKRIATDPKFYEPVIKIVGFGLGIVLVFLIFQLGALQACFNETACIFDWIPYGCKNPCLAIVSALSGQPVKQNDSNTELLTAYPRQGSAVRNSMNRRVNDRRTQIVSRRPESEDGGNDTSFSYLEQPIAPGVSTMERSGRIVNQNRIYPNIQNMPEKSIEFI